MAKIRLTTNWIEIEALANDPAFVSLINHVSGIHATRRRNIYCCSRRLLPDVLFYLRNISDPELLPDGPAKTALTEELQRVQRTRLLKEYGSDIEYPGLWSHQSIGVELAQVNKRYNFFYDTRTGKTRMAYQIMLNALRAGKVRRCIVFTPSTIMKSWLEDAKVFPELKVVAFYGTEKDKAAALSTPCHIVIWSEGMAVKYLDLIKAIKFDLCFFDESSKMKNYRSQISKAMLEYSQTVPYWYNLSATPAPNGEHEYYIQMRTVDPYAFNPARGHFVTKYFINTSRSDKYEKLSLNPAMHDEFMQIVEDRSIYVDQSVMPTAGKQWHITPFALPPELWVDYENMRKKLATEVDETVITAETSVAMRAKLCQITSGFVMDTDAIQQNRVMKKLGEDSAQQEVYVLTRDNQRMRALLNLLFEIGVDEQVVIWAHYEQEFVDIERCLNAGMQRCRILKGGSTIQEKEDAIALFKAHKLQYLVCHPLSVGMGINLTEAHNAIYYRVTDSWEALKQSSERIYGHVAVQPNKCHYWVLCATGPTGEDTVDKLVYDNVSNKRDASTGFLEYLHAGCLTGGTHD